jgi:hypothetical protein
MKDSTKILGFILVVALAFFLGARYGRKTAKPPVDLRVIWDTTEVTVYREKIVEKPVPKLIYKDRIDTMWLPSPHGDSSLVEVPIERKIYHEDSLYHAVVSGFRPSLDTLIVWPTTTTITVHEKSPAECRPYSWTLFPQAAVNYGGGALEMKASIGADISISENGRWRFSPEFGYRALQVNDRIQKGCYAEAKIKYNLIQVK